jgi:hypothetical protein
MTTYATEVRMSSSCYRRVIMSQNSRLGMLVGCHLPYHPVMGVVFSAGSLTK